MSIDALSDGNALEFYFKEAGMSPGELAALQGGDCSTLLVKLLSEQLRGSDSLGLVLAILLLGQRNPMAPTPGAGKRNSTEQDPDAQLIISRVASMLGACPVCCGISDLCRRCKGAGGPGTKHPTAEFMPWIVPALKLLRMSIVGEEVESSASMKESTGS